MRISELSDAARKLVQILTVTFALLFLSLPLQSQTSQGTLQGRVTDQSGGTIAGAAVTVIDVARGITRTFTADSAGQYVASDLTPGTYTVRAVANGFQTIERPGVLVEVAQSIRVDLTLQPGTQNQTITVTEELPEVNTTDATLGGTVSNEAILELPLNGRNFERLLNLRPGVYLEVAGHAAGGASTESNGARFGTDMLTVEGVPAFTNTAGAFTLGAEYRVGDSQSIVSIDAIQEFNTIQNPKAEYGWRPGSVVNVGIKSGTNSLHGSAYAFGRDAAATDAANPFNPGQGATPALVEQFGATAGGPIVKDKLFWFLGYEGLRTYLSDPFVNSIPADAPLTPANISVSMVDACNNLASTVANPVGGVSTGGPFNPIGTKGPNGVVTALSAQLSGITIDPALGCKISPASSTVENLFPFTTTGNYQANLNTQGPLNNGFIKGDYALSEHHHISGFYYVSKTYQITNYSTGQLEPQWTGDVPSTVQMFTGGWTWTPSSNWVNDVHAGYDYMFAQTASGDSNLFTQGAWPNGYGFNSGVTAAGSPLYGGLPEIQITGFSGYLGAGTRTGVRGPDGGASFIDNVSYLHGKHAFRFGFQFMDLVYDNDAYGSGNGTLKFTSLENFLKGTVKSAKLLEGNPYQYARGHWSSVFFQDDYRVSTKITLNLGLRWEYQGAPSERNNDMATFNPNLAWPVQQVGGSGEPPVYNPYYKAFSPRIGVAWDVQGNGKTVVRAGFSVLRDPELIGDYLGVAPFGANVPDLGINTSGTALNLHTQNTATIPGNAINWNANVLEPNATQSVFPIGAAINVQTPGGVMNGLTGTTCLSPSDVVLSGVTPPVCSTQGTNPNFVQPFVAEWNLDVQRAITKTLTADIAYVGTHGGNGEAWVNINQPKLGAGWDTSAVGTCLASMPNYTSCVSDASQEPGNTTASGAPIACAACPYGTKYPFLAYIAQMNNLATSNYDALQMTLNERPMRGLAFLAAYTYSHALDDVSLESSSPTSIDAYHLRLNYGPSDFDITHRFTFSPTYTIPGIKVPAQMLQGWTVSGILSLYSGLPWFPQDSTDDLLGTNEFNDPINSGIQTWNYSGARSAFTSGNTPFPCYVNTANKNSISGNCTSSTSAQGAQPWAQCVAAATAPYTGNANLTGLALASLNNIGCYITQKGGILTPPAYGTVGNANRNVFRTAPYHNIDFSVAKEWKFKERYTAQFRAEFFNVFNLVNLSGPSSSSPEAGVTGMFGCGCATPDVAGNNPVLGSGGPRHIQFGLKLGW